MASIFESLYKPYFLWEQEGDRDVQPESKHECDDEDWGDTPSMMLSDSEDDTSIPGSPANRNRRRPLHLQEGNSGRQVRFSDARIREHSVTLGDLACCSCLPLSLDWDHREEQIYDINDYETMRKRSGRGERGKIPKLRFAERRRILEEAEWAAQQAVDVSESLIDREQDPTTVQDIEVFQMKVEQPLDIPTTCDPFALLAWGIFGNDSCAYPTMRVQVLED